VDIAATTPRRGFAELHRDVRRVAGVAMRRPIRVLAIAALLSSAGCTGLKQYRQSYTVASPTGCTDQTEAKDCAAAEAGKDPDYLLGIIEFDDQGALFDRKQFDFVMGEIDRRIGNAGDHDGTMLIAFVHGWDHNAAAIDANLEFFRKMLRRVSLAEHAKADELRRQGKPNAKPRLVVGAYLAWRGQISPWAAFNLPSFWNRKDTAHRIGERAAADVLLQLRVSAYAKARSRYLIMGHSFGGALVYSAMSQLVAQQMLARQDPATASLRLADSVILFNPAFEAARLQHLLETAGHMHDQYPGLTIFTSRSDWATKYAFPAARLFNTLALAYREIDDPIKPALTMRQRAADDYAVGHYERFQTHDLVKAGKLGCEERPDLILPPNVEQTLQAPPAKQRSDMQLVGQIALRAHAQLNAAYEAGAPILQFGKTCLVAQDGLLRKQLAVFNVAVDPALWDGHGIEQDDTRVDLFLGFLQKYIPFVAEAPRPEEARPASTSKRR
jgi:hypothetical protein